LRFSGTGEGGRCDGAEGDDPGQGARKVVHSVALDLRDIECMVEALREVRSPTFLDDGRLDMARYH
jgi:hypothetical protein